MSARRRREQAAGSGVIFDGRGNIVTSNHVIEGASQIDVVIADGRRSRATVVGTDPKQVRPFRDAAIERRFHAGIDEQLRAHDSPQEMYARYGVRTEEPAPAGA